MRLPRVEATILVLLICSLPLLTTRVSAQSGGVPTLAVDAAASRAPISPEIYGIANYGLDATFAEEIQVPNIRWGGDATSRYNWMVDSSNAGFDWYFMGGSGKASAVPGASADMMINAYKPAHATALITIPILPYVNKFSAWTCSFPVSVYGAQQSTNPYVFPMGPNGTTETCGNSLTASGKQLTDNDILINHIANTPLLQQQWVQHLVATFGNGSSGGVKYYQLDNEPGGWGNTHRDVLPNGAAYTTIVQLGQQYAAAVKQTDGSAVVLGPSDFTLGGWIGTPSQQNNLYAGQYYLQQMAAYEQQHGTRILDYFDEHYYFDVSTPTAQLAATRTLWDPTFNGGTWVEQYDFDGPMQLIPRFKGWINTYYPGTKLSISEYSIDSGKKSVVDAIAEMDVLGIYGREQLDFANMWSPPAPTDPIAYSFRMFRNYDGSGHQFGDTSISAVSSDEGALSLYAAQRSSDNAFTILAINKTTSSIIGAVSLANLSLPPSAQVYTYSGANLTAIVHAPDAAISGGKLGYTFPGYSATLFVVKPSLATTTAKLTASAAQISAGQNLTLSVVVSAQSGAAPTGTVTLMDGTITLDTSTLTNGGVSFQVTSLAAGTHAISAAYAGNSADGASTSNTVSVQVGAAQATATKTTLTASPPTAAAGQSIAVSATVAPTTGSGVPTGTITFEDGSTSLGSVSLTTGTAVMDLSTLSVGSHVLSAEYSGDGADTASVSNAQTVTVTTASNGPDYTMALSNSTLAVDPGQVGTLMVMVTPQNGFSASINFACSGLPSGWTCGFAPPSVSGNAAQSTQLTVSPTQSSQNSAPSSGMLLAIVCPFSLCFIGFAQRKPNKAQSILITLAVLSLAACGGGSKSAAPNPSGTYQVVVTASGSMAPTHTQQFALTING